MSWLSEQTLKIAQEMLKNDKNDPSDSFIFNVCPLMYDSMDQLILQGIQTISVKSRLEVILLTTFSLRSYANLIKGELFFVVFISKKGARMKWPKLQPKMS